jgi:hypothetical protein
MNYKYLLLLIILIIPITSFAQYQELVGIPGVDPGADFNAYINALYKLSIAIAALLAVVKIIVAGLKWMITDLVSGKEDAIKDIQGSMTGLLIIVAAVIILNTVNPQLTQTNVFVAPVGQIDNSVISEEKSASDCVGRWGSYAWKETSPGVYSCDPGEATTTEKTRIFKREYSCPLKPGSVSEYDCSNAKKECEATNGVSSQSKSINTGNELKFKIDCTPKDEL